ncbi:uncharacterized protein PHALS_01815 [Plasmopara halstedii]|uniref:Uncharacterized protein n=1 Tax=Plasmopara halstedii TaxID=4781 RepID=A0A0P1AVT4_PLAHL|nr:uncharacterized protein PHALS_01815 [Plasmopara halstedii]CEG45525.1 hypothetical protein PHALS_01815 [Plasmopara halstedii]|eukprot:XP_024581894.1 hypothetical protein PHALS_01815 [Plasmopara halstedii]
MDPAEPECFHIRHIGIVERSARASYVRNTRTLIKSTLCEELILSSSKSSVMRHDHVLYALLEPKGIHRHIISYEISKYHENQRFCPPSDVPCWDFTWMAIAVQSLETYEAALQTTEIQSSIILALSELLQAPEAHVIQLQEIFDVLLQMIAFPIDPELPQDTVITLHSNRDWAIQTLFDIPVNQTGDLNGNLLQLPTMSQSLQLMKTKLFVSGPCRLADVQMDLNESLLAACRWDDKIVLFEVLEMCATLLDNDEQFLHFAEAVLTAETEAFSLGTAFLQRLFNRQLMKLSSDEHLIQQKRRLFDALTMESKIRVWANHIPSWRSHLQSRMLDAHAAPFKPITSVLSPGWQFQSSSSTYQFDAMVSCRRYSQLYVTFVEWCRDHVDLFSSCRGMELVGMLSHSTRLQNAAHLFRRQLLNQIPLESHLINGWSRSQRDQAFVTIGCNLKRLLATRDASDSVWQYEWIGLLERPWLLHEALDAAFSGDISSTARLQGGDDTSVVHNAIRFISWYYSFITVESAHEVAALLTTVSSELKVSDIRGGAVWLRRNRAEFGSLTILRLRLVWFWLLKSLDNYMQTIDENDTTAAVTDVLESVEYVFRRFTPLRTKRLFQVEVGVQLLVELEWRAVSSNIRKIDIFLERIAPLCVWLAKIVQLMQLEEQNTQYKDNRNQFSKRKSTANDVQHLNERLAHLIMNLNGRAASSQQTPT